MPNHLGIEDGADNTWGYHQMRIPENEYHILVRLLPDLNSRDVDTRTRAWNQFARSPLAAPYHVGRTPAQVKRSNKSPIIIK